MKNIVNIELLEEIGGEYNQTYTRNGLTIGKKKKRFKRFKYIISNSSNNKENIICYSKWCEEDIAKKVSNKRLFRILDRKIFDGVTTIKWEFVQKNLDAELFKLIKPLGVILVGETYLFKDPYK